MSGSRKKKEEGAREKQGGTAQNREENLHATLESTADGILAVDENGKVVFANTQFAKMWRIPQALFEEGADDKLLAFVLDQLCDPEQFLSKVLELYRSTDDSFDTLRFHDGRVFERYSRPLTRAGRLSGRVWSFRDVTERCRTEHALRSSEERYRMVTDLMSDYVFRLKVEADGRVAMDMVTDNFFGITGRTLEEVRTPDLWTKIIHPDDLPGAMRLLHTLVVEGGTIEFECRSFYADGRMRWVQVVAQAIRDPDQSRTVAIVGAVKDISDRQQAVEDLRTSEAHYHNLVETSQDLIWQCDAEGRYVYLNPAWEELFGYKIEEMLGRHFWDFQSPQSAERDRKKFAGLMEGNVVRGYETVHTAKDGRDIHLIFNLKCLPGPDGKSLGTMGTAYDITERKRAEQERLRLEAQILQAQKLESLGVLAGGIAHDFNNILMAILGNADLALQDLSNLSPVRPMLDDINAAARRAADLCKQMLAYSGKGRFVVQAIDLSELVREIAHMLEVSISKKAALRYSLPEALPSIAADPTQIRQVVMNLIVNASESLGDKTGLISITTGSMECDRRYLSETHLCGEIHEGRYVYLEVTDSGCGMDAETMAKVFDPFFTTKFTGRGLGLAAVLGITRGHKGALKIYSEPGKGTSFKVLFPAVVDPPEKTAETAKGKTEWKGTGLILLVDDEVTVRTVGSRMLKRQGFDVVTAEDGRKALEVYRAHKDRIRCVLLDLTMPQMDGEETFRELRRINPKVRVIMSSGYNEQDVVNRFAGKGLTAFIQKPYQLANLANTLRAVLGDSDGD